MMVQFSVPGIPVGKGRPRITTRGGHARAYTPAKTVAFEDKVGTAGKEAMRGQEPYHGAVALHLRISVPIPVSWSKRKQADAAVGRIRPIGKPDIDNYIKAVADGLNGIVWKDDSQIVAVNATKWYDLVPRIDVLVKRNEQ